MFPTYASASESLTFFNTEQDIKLLGRYTEPVKLTVSIQSDSSSDSCETIGWHILDMLPQKPVPLTALESWISPLRIKYVVIYIQRVLNRKNEVLRSSN